MKKQNTLAFLVRNLESWPIRIKSAPVVDGYRWVNNGCLFLFDDHIVDGTIDMKITLHDWKVACLDSAAERTKESSELNGIIINAGAKRSGFVSEAIRSCTDKVKEQIKSEFDGIIVNASVGKTKPNDQVKNPSHYQIIEGFESITIIVSALTVEQWKGFCIGNILKYRIRAGKKGDLKQDIDKADFYEELYEQHKHLCKV